MNKARCRVPIPRSPPSNPLPYHCSVFAMESSVRYMWLHACSSLAFLASSRICSLHLGVKLGTCVQTMCGDADWLYHSTVERSLAGWDQWRSYGTVLYQVQYLLYHTGSILFVPSYSTTGSFCSTIPRLNQARIQSGPDWLTSMRGHGGGGHHPGHAYPNRKHGSIPPGEELHRTRSIAGRGSTEEAE